MKIVTNFEVGNTVYFMRDNIVATGEIVHITTNSFIENIAYGVVKTKVNYHVKCHIDPRMPKWSINDRLEFLEDDNKLFLTKDELLKSL